MHKKIFVGLVILVFLLSACSGTSNPEPADNNAAQPDAAKGSDQNKPDEEPAAEPTDTPSPPLPPPDDPGPAQPEDSAITNIILGSPVPADQQWRMVEADYDLWLINQDGSQVIEVRLPAILDYQAHHYAVSPSGEYVAIHAEIQVSESALFLWSTVYGHLEKIVELFNGCKPGQEEQACHDMFHATGKMAWSNDSSQLAFTSAHLGSSSDLYVYDVDDGKIRGLTDGPAEALDPIWTPDDGYILHAAVDELYFGSSGSGYTGWEYYSAEPDGSKVHTLAGGSDDDHIEQEYLGWVSDHKMLLQSGRWYCGNFELRMINAVIKEEHVFWHGNYHGAAFNPEMGVALVYVDPNASEIDDCGPIDKEPGLYLVTIPGNKQTLLDVDPNSLYGYEMVTGKGYGVIFVRSGEGWIAVSADGRTEYFAGNPTIPREYWDLEMEINEIYGWVSPGG